ncbi:MAG: hypothetical protein Q9M28_10985 [Mariprofundaceae bacterium]|nr:hypothetical protein [Mariprofundaceae bacterium]
MKKSYTIEYDLHALHGNVQAFEHDKDVAIDLLQTLQGDLSQQQQLLSQLDKGYQALAARLEDEDGAYDEAELASSEFLEEKQYMDEMRHLVLQAEKQIQTVHIEMNRLHHTIKKRLNEIQIAEEKIVSYQQEIERLELQEDQSTDIKSILKSEILPPVYKTLEIVSTVKDLGTAFKMFYQRKGEEGRKGTFFFAALGFGMIFTGFIYLLVDMLSQLSLTKWLSLGAVISCTFIIGGIWAKWKASSEGMIASLAIFVGCLMSYSLLWLLMIKGKSFGVGWMFALFIGLNVLIYAYAYRYRVKALFFLSFSFSLYLVVYAMHEIQLLGAIVYLWCLSAVSLYLVQRLSWFNMVYFVFAMSLAALCCLLFPVLQVSELIGSFYYLLAVQGFFLLYLFAFLYLFGSGQSRLSELFLLMSFASFVLFVFFQVESSWRVLVFLGNALLLFLGGFGLCYGFKRETQGVILWMMSAALCMGVIHLIGSVWSPVLWGLEASVVLLLSFLLKMRVLRQSAYFLMLLAFGNTWYWMLEMLWLDFSLLTSFSWLWIDLLSMGVFSKFALLMLTMFAAVTNVREKLIACFLSEGLSLWLILMAAYTAYILMPDTWMIIALPLSLILLVRALSLKLLATEFMAIALMATVLLQLLYAFYQQKKLMFLLLDWDMQLVWLGLLGLLFVVPCLYRRYEATGLRARLVAPMMQTLYVLLPTCWLADVFFLSPTWFGLALWGSAFLMFLMHLWQRDRLYFIMHVLLTLIAALLSLSFYYQILWSLTEPYQTLSLLYAPIYFVILFSFVKAKVLRHTHDLYHYFILNGFYFSLLSLILWSLSWSSGWMLGCLLVQGITFWVSWRSPAYRLLNGQFPVLYSVTSLMPIPMLYMTYIGGSLLYAFLMVLSVLMATTLVHGRHGDFNQAWKDLALYPILLVISHLCFSLMYSVLLYLWLHDWFSIALTFFWLLHLIVLFVLPNIKTYYQVLRAMTVPLCLVITLKITFDDFKQGSMVEHILILVVFGATLVLGAYFMQRRSENK